MLRIVLLLSGGMDSAVVLGWYLSKGYEVEALSFRYGQNHEVELRYVRRLCEYYGVPLRVCDIPPVLGGSSLISGEGIPLDRELSEMSSGVPSTFVPGRNLVFLSLGVSYAVSLGIRYVAMGVSETDFGGYPDCRPSFIAAFQRVVLEGLPRERRVEIFTPLIGKTKVEIASLGVSLGVPFELTSSCYAPEGESACMRCDACKLRMEALSVVGVDDV